MMTRPIELTALAIVIGLSASLPASGQREAEPDNQDRVRSGAIITEQLEKTAPQIMKALKLDATRMQNVQERQGGLRVGAPFFGAASLPSQQLTAEAISDLRKLTPRGLDLEAAQRHPAAPEIDSRADEAVRAQRDAGMIRKAPGAQKPTVREAEEADVKLRPRQSRSDVIKQIDPKIFEGYFDASASPPPIKKTTSMSGLNDPGIAASDKYLTVVGYNRIAFYDKETLQLLGPKSGQSGFQNIITAMELFRPIWDPANPDNVNSYLNLPSNLPCDPTLEPAANPAETKYCLDDYYDLRVTYDRTRGRFWIVGLARNSDARGGGKPLDVLMGRRSIVIAAVSATSDPRDGFYLYWWPAPVEMGYCNKTTATKCEGAVEYRPGDAGDYPTIAVTEEYLLVGVGVANVIDAANDKNSARYSAVHVFRADPLAQGLANGCPEPCGWTYWNIPARGGGHATHVLQPARPTDGAYVTKSFFVRAWKDGLLAYAVDQPRPGKVYPLLYSAYIPFERTQPSSVDDAFQGVNNAPVPGKQDRMTLKNLGNHVISAFYRTGMIYVVMQDCIKWIESQSECSTSIRMVRANVGPMLNLQPFPSGDAGDWFDPDNNELSNSPGSYFLDRTFGLRGPGDAEDAVVYYGNPAVAVTNQGDIGVVYMRAGAGVYPEARYSLYRYDGEDILKSRLLAKGDVALTGNYDTGGAELDPDGQTLWFAHVFGDKTKPRFVISSVKP